MTFSRPLIVPGRGSAQAWVLPMIKAVGRAGRAWYRSYLCDRAPVFTSTACTSLPRPLRPKSGPFRFAGRLARGQRSVTAETAAVASSASSVSLTLWRCLSGPVRSQIWAVAWPACVPNDSLSLSLSRGCIARALPCAHLAGISHQARTQANKGRFKAVTHPPLANCAPHFLLVLRRNPLNCAQCTLSLCVYYW